MVAFKRWMAAAPAALVLLSGLTGCKTGGLRSSCHQASCSAVCGKSGLSQPIRREVLSSPPAGLLNRIESPRQSPAPSIERVPVEAAQPLEDTPFEPLPRLEEQSIPQAPIPSDLESVPRLSPPAFAPSAEDDTAHKPAHPFLRVSQRQSRPAASVNLYSPLATRPMPVLHEFLPEDAADEGTASPASEFFGASPAAARLPYSKPWADALGIPQAQPAVNPPLWNQALRE